MPQRRRSVRARAAFVLLVGAGCATPPQPSTPATPSAEEAALTGVFHVIWGDTAHFFVTDPQGRTTELLIAEALMEPYGGPRGLMGHHVRIGGYHAAAGAGPLQVTTIERIDGEVP